MRGCRLWVESDWNWQVRGVTQHSQRSLLCRHSRLNTVIVQYMYCNSLMTGPHVIHCVLSPSRPVWQLAVIISQFRDARVNYVTDVITNIVSVTTAVPSPLDDSGLHLEDCASARRFSSASACPVFLSVRERERERDGNLRSDITRRSRPTMWRQPSWLEARLIVIRTHRRQHVRLASHAMPCSQTHSPGAWLRRTQRTVEPQICLDISR